MKLFVFRNTTLENILGIDNIVYSGYNDIINIDLRSDIFIWFYQVPVGFNRSKSAMEVDSWLNSIKLIHKELPSNKTFIIFTLSNNNAPKFQSSDFSLEFSINKFNNDIVSFSKNKPNVKIFDIKEFENDYTCTELFDWKYYFISKLQINPKLARRFQSWFSRKLEEINLIRKKCLVLDLDNTLWGGVLGEDGIDGIKIGGSYPGNAFEVFQEFLIELQNNGIILTICSKNNEKDVLDLWSKNPFVKLKQEHIAAHRINWNNKAENIRELSQELNIGLDSLVFIDDNPTERELVKQLLPEVEVPEFPEKPHSLPEFSKFLLDRYFRIYSITEEDRHKTEQYRANIERVNIQQSFSDFSEYLRSLEIEISIENANNFNIPRIAQMTQKTNQFNLTTKRYSDADISGMIESGDKIYCISVKDRFGDNGITGCIIINKIACEWHIDSFLLSCRILGKGIENAFIKEILLLLKDDGVNSIYASYFPTEKNKQVENFYEKVGFDLLPANSLNHAKHYSLNLNTANLVIEEYYNIKYLIDERTNI